MPAFIKVFRNFRTADQAVADLLAEGCAWQNLNLIVPQAATVTICDPNLEPLAVEVYDQTNGHFLPALTRLVHCQRPVVSAVLGSVFVVGIAANQLLRAERAAKGARSELQARFMASGLPGYLAERYLDAVQQGELLLWAERPPDHNLALS